MLPSPGPVRRWYTQRTMALLDTLRQRARLLKRDTYALYLAARDPRTPWYVKLVAGAIVSYALSPIDLIPDFIPVLGYLDDLIILPIGLLLAVKMVPAPVLADCRAQAELITDRPTSRTAAMLIVAIWIALAVVFGYLLVQAVS
jgi:uncharacterized membrane protein YkvA (DUF1232 family)